jgi:hypothetical protein
MRSLSKARALRLCFVLSAVLVVSAVATASASAGLPEFRGVSESSPANFTIAGSSFYIETAVGEITSCKKVSGSGSITGPKIGHGTITLSECSTFPHYCHGKGLPVSELKTVELEVIPVYTVKGPQKIGLELRPKTGTKFAELQSPFGNICELKGSLIAGITTISGKEFQLNLTGSHGIQTPSQYETESHEIVNSWLEINNNGGTFVKESWSGAPKLLTSKVIELVG